MTSFKSIWNFTLIPTGAARRRDGSCVMEAVSWLSTGDLNRDVPGVCPIIRAQAIAINDSFPDTHRQDLRGFIPQLIGTADPASYLERHAYLCRQTLRLYASLILRYYDLPLDEDHLTLFTEFRDTGKVNHLLGLHKPSRRMTAGFVFNYAQAVNRCGFHTRHSCQNPSSWPLQHAPRKQRLGIRIGMMRILEGLLNIGKQAPALDEQRAREAARTFALREAA